MNTLSVAIDEVSFGERLREVDEDWAQVLADSIAEHGLMSPIEVRETPGGKRPYVLVAGGHRLRAMQLLGKGAIEAVVFDGDAISARLREIEENLIRHELTVLDRAAFVAEQKSLYEALNPTTVHGKNNKLPLSGQVGHTGIARFTKQAAERVGLSERALRRLAKLHAGLAPAVRSKIGGTWLANHGQQLDLLAACSHADQVDAVALLFGDAVEDASRPRTVGEALDRARGVTHLPIDKDDKAFAGLLSIWRKASPKAKRRFRDHISKESAR